VVSGCGHFPGAPDSGGTENRPPQTQILKAYAVPDTVAPGDTARFVCVIKDSTDNRFKFLWYIGQGKVLDAEYSNTYNGYVSNTNTIKWEAPIKEGSYSCDVYAYNGSKDSVSVDDVLQITVKQ